MSHNTCTLEPTPRWMTRLHSALGTRHSLALALALAGRVRPLSIPSFVFSTPRSLSQLEWEHAARLSREGAVAVASSWQTCAMSHHHAPSPLLCLCRSPPLRSASAVTALRHERPHRLQCASHRPADRRYCDTNIIPVHCGLTISRRASVQVRRESAVSRCASPRHDR